MTALAPTTIVALAETILEAVDETLGPDLGTDPDDAIAILTAVAAGLIQRAALLTASRGGING